MTPLTMLRVLHCHDSTCLTSPPHQTRPHPCLSRHHSAAGAADEPFVEEPQYSTPLVSLTCKSPSRRLCTSQTTIASPHRHVVPQARSAGAPRARQGHVAAVGSQESARERAPKPSQPEGQALALNSPDRQRPTLSVLCRGPRRPGCHGHTPGTNQGRAFLPVSRAAAVAPWPCHGYGDRAHPCDITAWHPQVPLQNFAEHPADGHHLHTVAHTRTQAHVVAAPDLGTTTPDLA
jgi:hypothetical protein